MSKVVSQASLLSIALARCLVASNRALVPQQLRPVWRRGARQPLLSGAGAAMSFAKRTVDPKFIFFNFQEHTSW